MPQTAENKLKILIAGLSQFSKNENDLLPTPDYKRLAKDLGLPNYSSVRGVWRRLRNELKRAGHGDLRIRHVPARTRSPVRRREADEPITIEDDPESPPTKRVVRRAPKKKKSGRRKKKMLVQNRMEKLSCRSLILWTVRASICMMRFEGVHAFLLQDL